MLEGVMAGQGVEKVHGRKHAAACMLQATQTTMSQAM